MLQPTRTKYRKAHKGRIHGHASRCNLMNYGSYGLKAIEPERLADLRKNRMSSLKETENIKYTDLENIKKEVLNAKRTFQKYKWPLIDVTRKSVEETAASIIKIHEIYLNNVK